MVCSWISTLLNVIKWDIQILGLLNHLFYDIHKVPRSWGCLRSPQNSTFGVPFNEQLLTAELRADNSWAQVREQYATFFIMNDSPLIETLLCPFRIDVCYYKVKWWGKFSNSLFLSSNSYPPCTLLCSQLCVFLINLSILPKITKILFPTPRKKKHRLSRAV